MAAKCEELQGIRVGRPRVKPTTPTHYAGIRKGNAPGNYENSPGHLPDGRSTARRSTGVCHKDRDPILPEMPNLSPA